MHSSYNRPRDVTCDSESVSNKRVEIEAAGKMFNAKNEFRDFVQNFVFIRKVKV